MKGIQITVFFIIQSFWAFAQIDKPSTPFNINLDNYSTSFMGDMAQKTPLLIVATPNSGMYTAGIDYKDAYPQFRNLAFENQENTRIYNTNDSSEMHFFVVNINSKNASKYEFRVSENGIKDIISWQTMRVFTPDSVQINNFEKGMAYLGGYKTTWNNYVMVEVREKAGQKVIEKGIAYWQQIKPEILNIYTANDLNIFLKRLKEGYSRGLSKEEKQQWEHLYQPDDIDSVTFLPKKWVFEPKEDNLIFFLKHSLFDKKALEYQLIKNGKIYSDWQSNDYDNNFIWIKGLEYGDYTLKMRLAMQRHNVSECAFTIKPEWHQTKKAQYILDLLICVLFSLAIYFLEQREKLIKSKKEKQRIDAELKSIRAQLNPHFVFNALTSIQGLVNNNKTTSVNYYLTAFSTLLRESLKNNDKEFVPLSMELKNLETYIKLENLRFPFQFKLDIGSDLNTDAIEMPYLLLQPLVENAIKHGISNLYEKGRLTVKVYANDKDLKICIQNNGKGFNPQKETKGYGLKLTKERIRLLNNSNPQQPVTLSFDSNKDEGTTVHLTFENWL